MRALAIFHGRGDHWLAPLLKRGFSHVAAALEVAPGRWVLIDPGLGTPKVEIVEADDIATKLAAEGMTTVDVETREIEARSPFLANTCVGVVKKLLGVSAPFALTPYRLYRHLRRHR